VKQGIFWAVSVAGATQPGVRQASNKDFGHGCGFDAPKPKNVNAQPPNRFDPVR
jgi:hypothetical protein